MRLVILGTDTDAGKTALSALLLAAFPDRLAYWKPLQTGRPDSETIARLVPSARQLPALATFPAPVAPVLAARRAGQKIPGPQDIARAVPDVPGHTVLIETFGSPLSPLTERTLQIDYLRLLDDAAFVLVTPSAVGAVGRTLQTVRAVESHGLLVQAVVLLGPQDEFAHTTLAHHLPGRVILSVAQPRDWTAEGFEQAAGQQRPRLAELLDSLDRPRNLPAAPARPEAADAAERARRLRVDQSLVWHPFTPLNGPEPLEVVAAEDEFLVLADGRRVVDAIGSWWTILHGHRDPQLVAAAERVLRELDHVHFAGLTHRWAVAVAELLMGTMDWPEGGRVFFSDDGSTAVEVALKLAYQYWCINGRPERSEFVGFEGGYHGDTCGAMSVSRDRVFFGHFEPLLFPAHIIPLCPDRLSELLDEKADRIAAIVLEPLVQGAGGMRIYSPELLRQLVAVARQHGVLVILDEVLTGLYRTGRFWAHQHAGVRPDLVCTAKALAGGLCPLAATLVAPQIVSAFTEAEPQHVFYHGHTFTAHPVACSVAEANLRRVLAEGEQRVRRLERFFKRRLEPLRGRRGVRDVRVLGNIAAVELDLPGGYLADVRQTAVSVGLRHGVLLRPLGPVLYAIPPWCTSDRSLEAIAASFEACVAELFE